MPCAIDAVVWSAIESQIVPARRSPISAKGRLLPAWCCAIPSPRRRWLGEREQVSIGVFQPSDFCTRGRFPLAVWLMHPGQEGADESAALPAPIRAGGQLISAQPKSDLARIPCETLAPCS